MHRHVKRFYARTNKINAAAQIAKHQRREALLRGIQRRDQESARTQGDETVSGPSLSFQDRDPLPSATSPLVHYHISESRRHPIDLQTWLTKHRGDPALKVRLTSPHVASMMLTPAGFRSSSAGSYSLPPGWRESMGQRRGILRHGTRPCHNPPQQNLPPQSDACQLHYIRHAARSRLNQSPHAPLCHDAVA